MYHSIGEVDETHRLDHIASLPIHQEELKVKVGGIGGDPTRWTHQTTHSPVQANDRLTQ